MSTNTPTDQDETNAGPTLSTDAQGTTIIDLRGGSRGSDLKLPTSTPRELGPRSVRRRRWLLTLASSAPALKFPTGWPIILMVLVAVRGVLSTARAYQALHGEMSLLRQLVRVAMRAALQVVGAGLGIAAGMATAVGVSAGSESSMTLAAAAGHDAALSWGASTGAFVGLFIVRAFFGAKRPLEASPSERKVPLAMKGGVISDLSLAGFAVVFALVMSIGGPSLFWPFFGDGHSAIGEGARLHSSVGAIVADEAESTANNALWCGWHERGDFTVSTAWSGDDLTLRIDADGGIGLWTIFPPDLPESMPQYLSALGLLMENRLSFGVTTIEIVNGDTLLSIDRRNDERVRPARTVADIAPAATLSGLDADLTSLTLTSAQHDLVFDC